jgi:potassium/chloride transporter 9
MMKPAESIKNSLGTLNGVFIPCSLNIMGIILFLRFGWSVGQAGVLGTIGILAIAEVMAVLTVLSFSAIVTNGNMAGGGSYFMISRSLGPEFGGAIGILFYLAYAVGVSFYIVGFATEIQSTFFETSDPATIVRIVGSLALFACLVISWIGADAFAKFNVWFFVIQYGAIVWSICSILGGRGFSVDNLDKNLWSNYTNTNDGTMEVNSMCDGSKCSSLLVFAIVFPAATGIMEGANLSGDLKDPSKSIPRGTLMAVGAAILTYLALLFTLGGAFKREELRTAMTVLQDNAWPNGKGGKLGVGGYIVVTGIVMSALSSALGSLFGGSRVLQAVARDNLFPGLSYFGKGTDHGDEPRRAVLFTWAIAQCCVMVGNLDVLAPIITAFFLISYALCNLTAFALSVTGAPNFRPTFRYFSWQLSLLGFLMCLVVMFVLSPLNSAVALILLVGITIFIWFRHPVTNWGDVSQALMYHQVRKYLLRLDENAEHAKFWRPSIVLFLDDMKTDMIGFCRTLKKGGLLVLGNVLVGELADLGEHTITMRKNWLSFIQKRGLKAFPQVTVAPSLRVGYQFLMQGSGLGGLRCNTIALPFFQDQNYSPSETAADQHLSGKARTVPRSPSYYRDVGRTISDGHGPPLKNRSQSEDMEELFDQLSDGLGEKNSLQRGNGNELRRVSGDLPVSDAGEYVGIIKDALTLEKNVIICRNFRNWSTSASKSKKYIDIWFEDSWDGNCSGDKALMLQLATILTLKEKSKYEIRVLVVGGKRKEGDHDYLIKQELELKLAAVRIRASVFMTYLKTEGEATRGTREYDHALHDLISSKSANTSMCFITLPKLPASIVRTAYSRESSDADAIRAGNFYLASLARLSEGLPVALVKAGEKADVISTSI